MKHGNKSLNRLKNINSNINNINQTNKNLNLDFILETFQCNISQEQAWALIYQSTKILNDLIYKYECDSNNKSELKLRQLTTFSNIILDNQGNVLSSTWNSRIANGNNNEQIVIDRKSMIESINKLVSSLAVVVYSALEYSWRQQSNKCNVNDDDQDSDDDVELDLEESLDSLMMSMLRGSENADFVDEGYIDALEESCIPVILSRCQAHFNELIDSDKKNSIVAEMFLNGNLNDLGADYYYRIVCKMMVDEALTVNKLLTQFCDNLDYTNRNSFQTSETHQSSQNLIDTESLKIWAQTWVKVMSELRFGVHLRPVPLADDLDFLNSCSNKKSSALPSNLILEQIKLKRQTLRKTEDLPKVNSNRGSKPYSSLNSKRLHPHHSSLPIISQKTILECLRNLKPAYERNLSPLISKEPCLHERLMNEIRNRDFNLRPTNTVIKPSIRELYLNEKTRSKASKSITSLRECQSLLDINDCNKRKVVPDSPIHDVNFQYGFPFTSRNLNLERKSPTLMNSTVSLKELPVQQNEIRGEIDNRKNSLNSSKHLIKRKKSITFDILDQLFKCESSTPKADETEKSSKTYPGSSSFGLLSSISNFLIEVEPEQSTSTNSQENNNLQNDSYQNLLVNECNLDTTNLQLPHSINLSSEQENGNNTQTSIFATSESLISLNVNTYFRRSFLLGTNPDNQQDQQTTNEQADYRSLFRRSLRSLNFNIWSRLVQPAKNSDSSAR